MALFHRQLAILLALWVLQYFSHSFIRSKISPHLFHFVLVRYLRFKCVSCDSSTNTHWLSKIICWDMILWCSRLQCSHIFLPNIVCLPPWPPGRQCRQLCVHGEGSYSLRGIFHILLPGRVRFLVLCLRYLKQSVDELQQDPGANLAWRVLKAALLDISIDAQCLTSLRTCLLPVAVQVKHGQTILCYGSAPCQNINSQLWIKLFDRNEAFALNVSNWSQLPLSQRLLYLTRGGQQRQNLQARTCPVTQMQVCTIFRLAICHG